MVPFIAKIYHKVTGLPQHSQSDALSSCCSGTLGKESVGRKQNKMRLENCFQDVEVIQNVQTTQLEALLRENHNICHLRYLRF